VEFYVGTLDEIGDARSALRDVGTVYHLVAAGSGGAAEIFQATVAASQNLLDALLEVPLARRPKVVLVSSFSVYGTALLRRGTLVDESTPLEPHPKRRDLYAQAKLWQERLFWECREQHGLHLVVLRPGVIYGPGGAILSPRVGLSVGEIFLHLGGRNRLPLTYVENCAEAIVVAGRSPATEGEVYNVVDDDLPTCSAFLRRYCNQVHPLRVVHLPYCLTMAIAIALRWFNALSPRKLPALVTPYRTAATWRGNRFTNAKIKSLGFAPVVPTQVGLEHTFAALTALHSD
jgi:nucleoside-diphosphate-sugar epimerase